MRIPCLFLSVVLAFPLCLAAQGLDDLPDGAVLHFGRVPFAHGEQVWRLSFSRDGSRIISKGNRWLRCWDFRTGDCIAKIRAQGGSAFVLLDGDETVVTAHYKGSVLFRSLTDGSERGRIQLGDCGLACLALSPDERFLAVGGTRRTVVTDKDKEGACVFFLYDLVKGRVLGEMACPGRRVSWMDFSPDGKMLAAACSDAFLQVFALPSGRRIASYGGAVLDENVALDDRAALDARKVRLRMSYTAFTPDGGALVGLAMGHSLSLWSLDEGELILKITASQAEQESGAKAVSAAGFFGAALLPDGSGVVLGGGGLRLFSLSTGAMKMDMEESLGSSMTLAVSPDGGTVAGAGSKGVIRRWDRKSGKAMPREGETEGEFLSFAFSPKGDMVASGDHSVLRLWSRSTGKQLGALRDHGAYVWSLAFSPDGARVASAGSDGSIRIWPLEGEELPAELKAEGEDLRFVRFLDDGERLLSVSRSGAVRVWKVEDKELQRSFQGLETGCRVAALSTDGLSLALGGPGPSVVVWDLGKEEERFRMKVGEDKIASLAFSLDDSLLACGGRETDAVWVWDAGSGQVVGALDPGMRDIENRPTAVFGDDRSGIWKVAFLPGGDHLVARSAARPIQVLRLADGKRISFLKESTCGKGRGMALSPDGLLCVAGSGKVAHLWRLRAP